MAKSCFAIAMGAACADALLFMHKREHLRRHAAEAGFLGFRFSVRGSLWNPFSVPELLLEKEPGDPEEDRLLADLVVMHGPSYGREARPCLRWDQPAAAVQCCLALAAGWFPRLAPLVLPLSGLTMLAFLISKSEAGFAKFEDRRVLDEFSGFRSPSARYFQWNFLSLEAKRTLAGRVPRMAAEIGRVLVSEAGFTGASAVLEAGAGGGFLWKQLPAELKAGWTQVEKNPHAALYARRHGNGAAFVSADLKRLPFGDATFDGVAGLECFDSLTPEDLLGFLPEAKRVLRPGGRLVHLKDFHDWPGEDIKRRLNAFTLAALGRELVSLSARHRLSFGEISPGEAALLAADAEKEGPALRPLAKVLADMYAAGSGRDAGLTVPMLFSQRALKGFFLAAGFEIAADSMETEPGRVPGLLSYLVARKPPQ